MADAGFGQQDPSDSAGPFNELTFVIWRQLALISTVKVVQVKAVDAESRTVDVQPMVNQTDGENNATPHGVIFGVPYWQWQFGKNKIEADPAIDDIGIMLCADRDISAVKATKAVAPPGTQRILDAADGIYLGGILNGEPEQWIKFTDDGMEWRDKNSNVLTSGATGWEFTGPVKFNSLVTSQASIRALDGLLLDGDILAADGTQYAGNFSTGGTVTGTLGVFTATISLNGHHHTAQGATAPTSAAQA